VLVIFSSALTRRWVAIEDSSCSPFAPKFRTQKALGVADLSEDGAHGISEAFSAADYSVLAAVVDMKYQTRNEPVDDYCEREKGECCY